MCRDHGCLSELRLEMSLARGVWVGAQVDPLVIFVGVVSELGWGAFGRLSETWSWFIVFVEACAWGD